MSVTRNFGPLDQIPLTTKAIMREVGLMARERVVRRTRAGHGTNNAPFPPYSAAYAAKKAGALYDASAKGGARQTFQAIRGSGGGKVNLTVSGAMLNDIVLGKVDDDEVELRFSK
jgi:hypothetical protein